MGGHKPNQLPPYEILNQSVSTTVNSTPTDIFNKDNVGIQMVWTGTLSGTFNAQISVDYDKNTGLGTWVTIPVSNTITPAGSPGNGYYDLHELCAPWIRLNFTRVSGTGNITATIVGKGL